MDFCYITRRAVYCINILTKRLAIFIHTELEISNYKVCLSILLSIDDRCFNFTQKAFNF